MALTEFEKNMDIIAALDDEPNDVGGLSAAELKAKFDEGGKALQDYINNTLLPALDNAGVERSVLLPLLDAGFKYMRLNSDKVLEVSTDSEAWQATGSSGHLIYDKNGEQLPQRSRLKFANGEVTDDGTYTIVQGEPGPAYTAGENISISGSVIATKAFPCNPNLLDNWYFGNPVNQRNGYVVYGGANLYTDATCTTVAGTAAGGPYQAYPISSICVSFTTNATYYCKIGDSGVVPGYNGAGYGIDRWQALSSGLVLTISDGCITISNTEQGKGGTISEKTEVKNTGSPVVMSVLLKNGTLFVTSGVPTADASLVVLKEDLYAGFRASENNYLEALFYFSGTTVTQENIVAVKLELGTQQTLAHQENGVWVLNEIPDYGEQLRRCHRYYFKTASAQYSAYMMRKNTDDYLMDSCIFPVTMRTTPSVQLVSYRNPSTGAVITAEGDASQTTPDGFCVVNDAGKFAGSSVFQVAFSASADL